LAADASVSIVIPTKNAGAEFRKTLEAIQRQTRTSEIVIVDSGSDDGTLKLAHQFGAKIKSIPPQDFNHGETRNLGIREALGSLCVMLVQDAQPVGEDWLENLLIPLSDDRVVGVTGQQIPRPDSDLISRWQTEYRLRFLGESPRIQELDSWDHFLTLGIQERLRLASFDNVCSVVRREFWEECPFRPVAFAEDLDWGVRAIAARRRLVYNPRASVIHSHNRPATYHLRRSYISERTVPKILHIEPADRGVRSDKEFLELLGFLCGEARTILLEQITDWRAFARSSQPVQSMWDVFHRVRASLSRSSTYRQNGMRNDFYFIIDQVLQSVPESVVPSALCSIVPKALAEAVGSFSASYYNWCEARGSVSDGMQRLNQVLSEGV
jgi:glycosyltransferase involved in cell wall biosynthesis